MLNSKSFLAVDFGAGSLKLAEFQVNEAGALYLTQYAITPLGQEGAQEATREAAMLRALQKTLAETGAKSKNINVCAPGFHVFSKFVKLPPVETSKVTQIIQYEAQQNVPFPLEEVVWDYQILGQAPGGELEILLVAIKKDVVEGLFRVSEAAGLKLQLCDASPAALCNAFRYSYGDLDGCTMLLDIGAKTSNLLFFEKGKVFSRSINIGANAITQDFVNEAKLPWPEAEKIKVEEGMVSLGGAYEEPENPRQAAVAKIARQFMTRLHIQVNQTMQFYRGQQGGSAPARLFLSGGASIMTYTAQFFAEKLNVPVEYFNPLRSVQIDPSINLEELARVAHSLGEVVGLGLRNMAHCPVELNLMPESTLQWQSFNRKKPYLLAAVFLLTLVLFAAGWLFDKLATVRENELKTEVEPRLRPLRSNAEKFRKAHAELKRLTQESDQLADWMEDRSNWAKVLTELRRVLIQVENNTKNKLRTDAGVWIESLISASSTGTEISLPPPVAATPSPSAAPPGQVPISIPLEGETTVAPPIAPPPSPSEAPPSSPAPTEAGGSNANEISYFMVMFRAVSLSSVAGGQSKTELAFDVLNELKASPLFDAGRTEFSGGVGEDDTVGTFTFAVRVVLKKPLKR